MLSAGRRHTCGITTGGTAYCWGQNSDGQLGNGTTTQATSPVAVSGSRTWNAIAAGDYHTCGIASGNTLYCWGNNQTGQLGDGTTTSGNTPVAVLGGRSWASVTSGGYHTCGVTTAGAALCWGWNGWGQLGDGTTTGVTQPVTVAGGRTWSRVTAGLYYTCGIATDATGYCWGKNISGQAGAGTFNNTYQPTLIAGGRSWAILDAGADHTCGVEIGGAGYCWGYNFFGEVRPVRISPTPVVVSDQAPVISRPVTRNIRVSNIRDNSFTVTWVTDIAVTGSVRWGTAAAGPVIVAPDSRGDGLASTVHAVTVGGLSPGTRYVFDVISGSATETSAGTHFAVTTAPTIGVSSPMTAYGTISRRDGTEPEDVLVHLTATSASGTSATLTRVVTASDHRTWVLDLGSLRTSDLTALYPVTDSTTISIIADGGDDGTAGATITAGVARQGTSALVLGNDLQVTLGAGWNLIALPGTPVPAQTASAVCAKVNAGVTGSVIEVDRWQSGGWEGHVCGIPANDFAIETGRGYFVRTSRSATWSYAGFRAMTPAPLPLATGWNLIGVANGSASAPTAPGTCTTLEGAGAGPGEVNRWVNGGWEPHLCGFAPNPFAIESGRGYFVRVNWPVTWTPDGGTSSVSASSVSALSVRATSAPSLSRVGMRQGGGGRRTDP